MKAAFFYSHKMLAHLQQTTNPNWTATIDGRPYTEVVTLNDDAEVKPFSKWPDTCLVKVVDNISLLKGTVDLFSGTLAGRVKINF